VQNTINEINDKADKEYKYAHNLEQTPSENSAIKLASKDKVQNLQNEYALYSNQFIPLIVSANLLDRIRLQGMFDSEFSGGSIMHCGCDMRVESYENLMKMIRATVKAGVVYHAINYNLQKCEDGHMSVGKNDKCSICGKDITDNYVRVVGFIVNTKNFHKVRREVDYPNRQLYSKDDIESIGE
jgi:ribonucleoside-triphosphate reductase